MATVVVIVAASVRKFQKIGWLTWAGFISIFTAVFIVVAVIRGVIVETITEVGRLLPNFDRLTSAADQPALRIEAQADDSLEVVVHVRKPLKSFSNV